MGDTETGFVHKIYGVKCRISQMHWGFQFLSVILCSSVHSECEILHFGDDFWSMLWRGWVNGKMSCIIEFTIEKWLSLYPKYIGWF